MPTMDPLQVRSTITNIFFTITDCFLQLESILSASYYAYPAVVFGYLMLSLALTLCTNRAQKLRIRDEHVRRELIIALIASISGLYVSFQILPPFLAAG